MQERTSLVDALEGIGKVERELDELPERSGDRRPGWSEARLVGDGGLHAH